MYKSVVAELQKIPEIVECHFTTGPYTMLTKLYACDNEHLMDLLRIKGAGSSGSSYPYPEQSRIRADR